MTRTPDEIKKGLDWCKAGHMSCNDCPYYENLACREDLKFDALALIQQLHAELEDMTTRYKIADDCAKKKGEMNEKLYAELSAVKAERDAAIRDMMAAADYIGEEFCLICGRTAEDCKYPCNFKWRGVQKEE